MSLYKSLFNPKGGGIFEELYSSKGASPPTQRSDFRLGGLEGLGQEAAPEAAPAPSVPAAEEKKVPIFERDIAGLPLWVLAVGFLGFAYAWRKKRKKKKTGK